MVWRSLYRIWNAETGRWHDVGQEIEEPESTEGLRRAASGGHEQDKGSEDQQRGRPEGQAQVMAKAPDHIDVTVRVAVEYVQTVTHACPTGHGVTPCCGRTMFELPQSDRVTVWPEHVTCAGRA